MIAEKLIRLNEIKKELKDSLQSINTEPVGDDMTRYASMVHMTESHWYDEYFTDGPDIVEDGKTYRSIKCVFDTDNSHLLKTYRKA